MSWFVWAIIGGSAGVLASLHDKDCLVFLLLGFVIGVAVDGLK